MRQSEYYIPTLKESPSDTNTPSHSLMLRAGLVRGLAAGVFSFLPLGYRVMQKIQAIIRQEMNAIGGQEFLLSALTPTELWEQTGRIEDMKDVLFHIKNREGLVLAPTHEETITYLASQHVKSYKHMPQIWYQIQTKFRNEARPKSGVIRGRQFIMKDAYSLDSTWEGLDVSYDKHHGAYHNIFSRCGLRFFAVGASSGAMGGKKSQEFMVESDAGEDVCAVAGDYAANLEVATSGVPPVGRIAGNLSIEKFATPNARTIDELIEQFGLPAERLAKSVVYIVEDKPVLILMRGNDELNETKLQAIMQTPNLRPATGDELIQHTGVSHGSIGPVGAKAGLKIIADNLLKDANGLVSGANEDGYHLKNIDLSRDANVEAYYDLRTIEAGEPSILDGQPLRVVKAIEVGHIFKLGTKYSQALSATFLDANGSEHPIIMGSYGIGVERIAACYIEQNHDERGIIWDKSLAPFDLHLLGLNVHKTEEVRLACENILRQLEATGYEILYDDREETAGIKFNDADLIGLPLQIVVGQKNLKEGNVEIKIRRTDERLVVNIADLASKVVEIFSGLALINN